MLPNQSSTRQSGQGESLALSDEHSSWPAGALIVALLGFLTFSLPPKLLHVQHGPWLALETSALVLEACLPATNESGKKMWIFVICSVTFLFPQFFYIVSLIFPWGLGRLQNTVFIFDTNTT